MKSILLPPLFLLCSVAANAMDYKPVIQSLMNDVCSTSQNVSVCMYQFSAAVKAGKAIGENVELCKKVANEERAMLDCESSESSAQFVDALFDTNRKAVASVQ
ncbi:TPA: hypothetical protein RS006_003776 [Escherichia coli]|nr:hypothetical protein [Escherichia coli]